MVDVGIADDGRAMIHLDQPPQVVRLGVGRHGTTGLIDRFSLPELWSLHLYNYRATLVVEDRPFEIKPDDMSLVPPNTRIVYRYLGPSQHLYAHLRIRPDGAEKRLPLVWPAGSDAPMLTSLMTRAVESFQTSPDRSRSYIWATLCRLEEASGDAAGVRHSPYVAAGITFLQAHLASPVTVPEVARQLKISHNHLTRLFQAELGCTVIGYLRNARLTLAAHLLRDSTMSIAEVATTVGIPDLQAFNKACRRSLGASPRAIRAASSAN